MPVAPSEVEARPIEFVRGLGLGGALALTIGSIVGTGIFLAPSDVARAVPHAGLVLLACIASGLLTIAGALTYAELGVLFPRAGGIYHFLKEAYGSRWGFLYGWIAFLVIMSGGIAAIAIGFATYLGAFLPWASPENVFFTTSIAGHAWSVGGTQIAAVAAILVVTAVNHVGLGPGARVQQVLVVATLVAILAVVVAAWTRSPAAGAAPLPIEAAPAPWSIAGFGVAMVAMLWTYDGWYGLTISAGELRNPSRDLPRGLAGGTFVVLVLYTLLIAAMLRALHVEGLAASARPAEAAANAFFGSTGGRLMSAIALVAALGCLASTVLYASRLYTPLASDGLFFRSLGLIHPRWRTPVRSLWAQSGWAAILALTGTYGSLYTYATCAVVLFHVATAAAVFVLRRRHPDAPRPYRVFGYPVVPALFIVACALLVVNTFRTSPVESGAGLALLLLGLPMHDLWKRRNRSRVP